MHYWFGMKNKTILIISPEPWGANFVSKHHYANYLAKDHTVYFLNPATGFARSPSKGMNIEIKPIKEQLFTIDYLNLLPRLNLLPLPIQKRIYRKQAQLIAQKINPELDIVWSFDPHRYFDQKVWSAEHSIYHTVDFHPGARSEKEMVLSSDLFLGVADLILDEHIAYRKGVLIPHAADLDGFMQKSERKIPGKNAIKACYVGNFHKHIDYAILQQLVQENPDCDFIMVGPTADSNLSAGNIIDKATFDALKTLPNIYFLGSISPGELMGIIKQCDINLVLFKNDQERIHCSPHKLMGYFYSGNVTLSNYIDAHKQTDEDIITMVSKQRQIPPTFQKIKNNLADYQQERLRKKRQEFAEKNSYRNKILEIQQLLSNHD